MAMRGPMVAAGCAAALALGSMVFGILLIPAGAIIAGITLYVATQTGVGDKIGLPIWAGICVGIGVSAIEAVTSPTFSIIQQYDAPRGPVVHADLYRLRSDAELEMLGWDELVDSAQVFLVEWPDRAVNTLPRDTIHVVLGHDPENADRRLLRIHAPTMR